MMTENEKWDLEFEAKFSMPHPLVFATAKIYTLADKHNNVFYVGVTVKSLEERVANHISSARSADRKNRKAAHLEKLNYEIVATVVHTQVISGRSLKHCNQRMRPIETEWILKYMKMGCDLINREVFAVKKLEEKQRKMNQQEVGYSIVARVPPVKKSIY
jgi:predicted GIY-YIG superfamily endonuclease